MGARMLHGIMARLLLTLALFAAAASQASARDVWDTVLGWWDDKCNGGYTCYGPPYANTTPPPTYSYDHRRGPTWTGNGWAYLPVGEYRPRPPEFVDPPPPPPAYRDGDDFDDNGEPNGNRPMK